MYSVLPCASVSSAPSVASWWIWMVGVTLDATVNHTPFLA
jgi:hypothetical protein